MKLSTILILLGILVAGVLAIWLLKPPSFMASFPSPPPFRAPVPEPKGAFSLEGKVTGPEGPLADSWVSLIGDKRLLSSRCGKEGKFLFEGLAEGSYQITAGARGFRPASIDVKTGVGQVTMQLEPLSVFGRGPYPPETSPPKERLLSKIIRKGGSTSGFAVALIPKDPRAAAGVFRALVDSEGFFEIEALPPGKYELRVLSAARAHDLEFCYKALEVEVGEGKSTPAIIEISCMEIRGRILAAPAPDLLPIPEPFPFPGAVIRLKLSLGDGNNFTEAGFLDSDAEGQFKIPNLPEGDYEIAVLATDFIPFTQKIQKAPGSVVDLKITLERKRP